MANPAPNPLAAIGNSVIQDLVLPFLVPRQAMDLVGALGLRVPDRHYIQCDLTCTSVLPAVIHAQHND